MSLIPATPEDHLDITPLQGGLSDVATPAPVVDLAIVERNVRALQAHCDHLGLANRPHSKTHKSTGLARFQIASGATGVTVQKLGEAEAMADGGVNDLMLTFNLIGDEKAARLARLMGRVAIAVTADNPAVVDTLAAAARRADRSDPLSVLVECDTGAGRAGVQTPWSAMTLATTIAATPGLRFAGLMTYPLPGGRSRAAEFLAEARRLCAGAGLEPRIVSTGGSPDWKSDDGLDGITEYRAGTSIYNDRSLVARGAATEEDCALSVHVTVVSRPTENRAIIDAGSKTFTSDLMGLQGYGLVVGHPDATLTRIDEEHGYLSVPSSSGLRPGDRLAIIPNHVCPVSNLFDRIVVHRGGRLLGTVPVDARGCQT